MRTNGSGLLDVFREVRDGWRWHELWLTLGWRDVLMRHDRSTLGPFWISANMAFVGLLMGSLYSAIMQAPAHDYIPYLVAGNMAWGLLSAFVSEGKDAFVSNAAAIREIAVPGTVYVYRVLWRNILVLGFNAIVYIAVMLFFRVSPFPAAILIVPGLAIILLNGLWVGLFLGLLNARFRDFGEMIPQAMRLAFFVTPILWYADTVTGPRALFVHLNPLYYFVEVLRAPLLGSAPSPMVWAVTLGITVLGWAVTLPVYAQWRRQITFWV